MTPRPEKWKPNKKLFHIYGTGLLLVQVLPTHTFIPYLLQKTPFSTIIFLTILYMFELCFQTFQASPYNYEEEQQQQQQSFSNSLATYEEHIASQIINEFPEIRNVLGQILDGSL